MQGEMSVNINQDRLIEINGQLMNDVKFGAGLLGYLDRGGWFDVQQAEIVPGHWEMTRLNIEMKGRFLLFKTIKLQQREYRSEFQRVPDDLTPAQAADLLRRQLPVATNRSG
jgi:hypothetical protein